MIGLSIKFKNEEKLYRAVRVRPSLIKKNGKLTRAVFKYTGVGSTGCSVDRQLNRANEDAIKYISSHLDGKIYSITFNECKKENIYVEHTSMVNSSNPFHSELYQNEKKEKLSDSQIDFLIESCFKEKD